MGRATSKRGVHRYKPDKKTGQLKRVKPRSKTKGTASHQLLAGLGLAKKVAPKKSQKGTLFGGVQGVLAAAIGLSVIVMVVARVAGFTGFAIGAGVTAGGIAAGRAGYNWNQRRKGKMPPKPTRGGGPQKTNPRHKPFVPDTKAGQRNRAAEKRRRPPPMPNRGPRPCSAACRRSVKPKSTCVCKAAPCFHGQEA